MRKSAASMPSHVTVSMITCLKPLRVVTTGRCNRSADATVDPKHSYGKRCMKVDTEHHLIWIKPDDDQELEPEKTIAS